MHRVSRTLCPDGHWHSKSSRPLLSQVEPTSAVQTVSVDPQLLIVLAGEIYKENLI